ncbi:amino acid permease [Ktedonospora formicarum]|nr:amino acid permease [Ktedonospora formicarum]
MKDSQEEWRLPRELGTRDLTAWLILIVLFYLSVSVVQRASIMAFFYWLLSLLFVIPISYVMCWLARHLSFHGGHYIWIRKMGGPRWGEITGAFTCLYGVCVILTTLQGTLILIHSIEPRWFNDSLSSFLGEGGLLLMTTLLALIPLHYLKHLLFGSAILYVIIFLVVGLAGFYWLYQGHTPGINLSNVRIEQPHWRHIGAFSIVMWAFMGTDWPFIMGREVRKEASKASRFVWWGSAWLLIAYIVATFGVLVVLPQQKAESLDAMFLTVKTSFGDLAGLIVLIVLSITQIAVSITILQVCSRMFMTMSQDKLLPKRFASIYRGKVPVIGILAQTSACFIIFLIIGVMLYNLDSAEVWIGDRGIQVNVALQALAALIWSLATILLYGLVIYNLTGQRARVKTSLFRLEIPSKASSLKVRAFCIVGIFSTLAGGVLILFYSWIPNMLPMPSWTFLIAFSTGVVLVLGWLCAEVTRQWRLTQDLKCKTRKEQELITQLRDIYQDQCTLANQQQTLLRQRDVLFREQAHLAVTDALTGLPNQRAIIKELKKVIATCAFHKLPCALLFVDVDHFKHINDNFGHRTGDIVLRLIGERLRDFMGERAIVGRYGGEEFVVILHGIALQKAELYAEKIRLMMQNRPFEWISEELERSISYHLTVSIGVVTFPEHACCGENLLRAADRAMYRAKARGRNYIHVEQPSAKSSDDPRIDGDRLLPLEATTLKALLALLQERDVKIYEHGQRVAKLSGYVAQDIGCSGEDSLIIRIAGLLHNIGNLNSQNEREYCITPIFNYELRESQEDIQASARILSRAGYIFSLAARTLQLRHEHWDGSGYPAGLRRTEIPLIARILAVVDTYDALITCYSYTAEAAYARLLIWGGTYFDIEVVWALGRTLRGAERFTDPALPTVNLPLPTQQYTEG